MVVGPRVNVFDIFSLEKTSCVHELYYELVLSIVYNMRNADSTIIVLGFCTEFNITQLCDNIIYYNV